MADTRHFCFFQNKECEFFPCHEGVDEENFNCLFCYCPLYALGKKCGGNYSYNEYGYKDCTNCTFPHQKNNYASLIMRYEEIMDVVRETDKRD